MKRLNLKKFLSLLLTLAMCLSLATTAFAVEETDPEETKPTVNVDELKTEAETAQGKAETAQGKAETAQGKAETAQEKADNAKAEAAATESTAKRNEAEATEAEARKTAADEAKTAADEAKKAADEAKKAADAANEAVGEGSPFDEVVDAEATYQGKLDAANEKDEDDEDSKSAAETVEETNEAINGEEGIVAKVNQEVSGFNSEAKDLLDTANAAIDNATETDSEGNVTVKNADEIAQAAQTAQSAAETAQSAAEAAQRVVNSDASYEAKSAAVAEANQAVNTANQAVETANQAVAAAESELNAAQAEVDRLEKAYQDAKAIVEGKVTTAEGEITGKLADAATANTTVTKANTALEAAKTALEEARAKETAALAAVNAAAAAKTAAEDAAVAAGGAMTAAAAGEISGKLDNMNLVPSEENPAGTIKSSIDTWEGDKKTEATTSFQESYKTNTALQSLKPEEFEALVENDADLDTLIEKQNKLEEKRAERDAAREAYENGKWTWSAGELLLAQTRAEQAYNDVVKEMTDTLFPPKNFGDKIVNAFAKLDHPTIRGIFEAKTAFEVEKANAGKYAAAAKAVVDAQTAQAAAATAAQQAETAKGQANAAWTAYQNAKTALDNAQALETLQAANRINNLADLEADWLAAQQKLGQAQANLNALRQAAADAAAAAQEAQNALPPAPQPPVPEEPEEPETPEVPETPDADTDDDADDDDDDADDAEAAPEELLIDDQLVPLAAGPVAIQNVLDVLYKFEGSPNGADPEGEFTLAIAWGVASDIIDEETDASELVTGAILKDILTRYDAAYDRAVVEVAALTTLTAADDEIVDNCGEVLAEFLGQEYAAPETDAAA